VIVRARRGEKIEENITSITLVEYPPIRNYEGFRGRIYFLDIRDQLKASLQEKLRVLGKPMGASDLLIAAVSLNKDEELVTLDEDFSVIKEIEPSFRVIIER